MENKIKGRDIGIDLVKFLAIIGVIIIHLCDFELKIGTSNWMWSLFWGSITRASVPLFLMASGAIMLKPEKEIPVKRLYSKNILRILVAMFFWGIVYKVCNLIALDIFSFKSFLIVTKEVLLFNQEFHFYYMHIILLVYAFLPITKIIIKNADEKQLRYLLMIWFVVAVLYPTLQPFRPFYYVRGLVPQWSMNLAYASIGYGILGYYLKRYSLPKWLDIIFIVVGIMMIFWGTYIMSNINGELYEHFLGGSGLGAAMLGTGLFSLINKVKIELEKTKIIIEWFSKASFCVYLCHMLIVHGLKKIGIDTGFASYGISIPVLGIIIFICSNGIYAILSHIPIVKKWIV